MPKTKKTIETIRNFRCPDRLWALVNQRAKSNGETVSAVIRRALVEYVTK